MAKRDSSTAAVLEAAADRDVLDSAASTAEAVANGSAPPTAADAVRTWLGSRASAEALEGDAAELLIDKGAKGGKPFQVDGRFWTVNRSGRVVEVVPIV